MRSFDTSHDLPRPPRNTNNLVLRPHLFLDPIARRSPHQRHGATKRKSLDPPTDAERIVEAAVEDGREEYGVLRQDPDLSESGLSPRREKWGEFEG